jgi:hypothetical protein
MSWQMKVHLMEAGDKDLLELECMRIKTEVILASILLAV